MLGVGAQHTKDPNGIAWKQNRDFENLLKRLNGDSVVPTEDGIDPAPIVGFQPARVHEPAAGLAKTGPETEGEDEDEKGKERKSKKKRPRVDYESAKIDEIKSKKRRQVESITIVPASEPVGEGPSGSNFPAPDTIPFVVILPIKMQLLTLEFQRS